MSENIQTSSTVQRGDTSVPAREGVQTGLNSSLSSDRLNGRVDPMALPSSNATGSTKTAQMEVDAQQTGVPPKSGRPVAPVNTNTYRGRINSLPTVTCQQSPMERLGSKIEELTEFIKDKRNLHHELRKLVASIATAYKLANKPASMSATTTQTSPEMTTKPQAFLVTPEKPQQGKENKKKRPLSTPSPSSEIDKPAQKKTARDNAWIKVTRQKKKKEREKEPGVKSTEAQNQLSNGGSKRPRRKKTRTKAVLVQPAEG
ncbi:uncharacterized protein LOC141524567 isoform X2 [Cotesia typhae]|uniref:uncharacterized protein LOC141524567 isoform X2 n=1 Tax=Cotesia typhae TaxID=2053667 RepID=UPI003D68A05D